MKDFDSLKPTNVKDIKGSKGGDGKTGMLPDGRSVNLRSWSSEGSITLEIQSASSNKKIKIRYRPN